MNLSCLFDRFFQELDCRMPPVCCRCNASGSCKNCSCKKPNQKCSKCLPLRRGHCVNSVEQPTQPVADHVVTCPTLPPNLHTEDDGKDCHFFTPPEIQVNSNFPPPPNDTDNITHTSTVADLPPFVPISTPNFTWGDLDGEAFVRTIDSSYDVIVHWRRNLFKVPSGKAGKAFIRELTRLFRAYADGSALENVALKAA